MLSKLQKIFSTEPKNSSEDRLKKKLQHTPTSNVNGNKIYPISESEARLRQRWSSNVPDNKIYPISRVDISRADDVKPYSSSDKADLGECKTSTPSPAVKNPSLSDEAIDKELIIIEL